MDETISLSLANPADRTLARRGTPRRLATVGTVNALARATLAPLVRRALVGLARCEPAPMLAVGFSTGLLASAVLRGRRPARRPMRISTPDVGTPPLADGDLLHVETLVIQTVRLLRAR